MDTTRWLFLAAVSALMLQAPSARCETNEALGQLQGIEAGGAQTYQNAADGSVDRDPQTGAPVVASRAPVSAPAVAQSGIVHRADAVVASPVPVGDSTARASGGLFGSKFSILGAGVGAAVGYGAAVLVSSTIFCLPLWGTLLFVAGGALLGGMFLSKLFG